jgi:hypothetical protein
MTFRTKDNGAKALLKRAGVKGEVRVGFIGAKAEAGHDEAEGLTVIEVATRHEFGEGVPKRSMIREPVDQRMPLIKENIRAAEKMYIKGDKTMEQALDLFGLWLVGELKENIQAGIAPPLSERRKQEKQEGGGPSTPLINTGQMISSLTHETKVHG